MRSMVAAAAVSIVFTTGCANNFSTSATKLSSAASTAGLGGAVHGGSQPIVGSSVQLYYAGNTGYGTGSAALGSAVTTGTGGSFNYGAYTCPANNPETYLLSTGGNTNGSAFGAANSNVNAVLMVALGPCSGIAAMNNINISEVTTAASIFALAQYINPGTSTPGSLTVGAPSTTQAQAGLTTAFSTVNLLTNITTGQAVSVFQNTGTATAVTAVTVTGVPEFQKLNTVADILAACVNTVSNTTGTNATSGQCTTLFTNAAPPPDATVTSQPTATFATAVDTAQAAYYMAVNPTDIAISNTSGANTSTTNLGKLYALATAATPYTPTIAAQPSDWTIGILYSDNGTTIANNGTATAGTATNCANGGQFINYGYQNSVDGNGNVWMANGGSSTLGNLAQMSPLGVPLNCSGNVPGTRGGGAIDTAGNVWAASNQGAFIYKFDGTTTTAIPVQGTGVKTYAVAADGVGNVFFNDEVNKLMYELPSTATATTVPKSLGAIASASTSPAGIAVGKGGTVYGTPNASTSITAFVLTAPGSTTYQAPQTISSTNYVSPYGIAIDASNNVWTGQSNSTTAGGNTLSYATPTFNTTVTPQTVTYTQSALPPNQTAGIQSPRFITIDGAGNVWAPNVNQGATGGLYSVSEVSKNDVALSPTQINGTSNTGGFLKSAAYFNGPRGSAIDASGNVWVTQTPASTTASMMVELVGAAVPVVTPISAQLSTGTGPVKP